MRKAQRPALGIELHSHFATNHRVIFASLYSRSIMLQTVHSTPPSISFSTA